jgi:serine/threonine protein kinase
MEETCPFCNCRVSASGSACPSCGSLTDPDQFADREIKPGTVFSDRYRIVKKIGQGGMGAVYMAEETAMSTGRYVAIKLLPAAMTLDKGILTRFKEEIKTAARLDHPNIVPIYFVGEQDGLYYFVMKYLEGASISQHLGTHGPFPEEKARMVLASVAEALAYAHSRGIIHRDIKAGNVMISPKAVPTLLDFGVARSQESAEVTRPGQIIGTAEYMAPEQWCGHVDPRSDLYSLGVLLHSMLTGSLPFAGPNAMSLMKAHQELEPPSMREVAPHLSDEIERIYAWCMTKELAERVPDGDTLAKALRGEFPVPDHVLATGGLRTEGTGLQESATTAANEMRGADPALERMLAQADKFYENGEITKAITLAQKAKKQGGKLPGADYRISKYENLQAAIDHIKQRITRVIEGGFIRQAVNDLEQVLTVYPLPQLERLYRQATQLVSQSDEAYAEGKKLQVQGKPKKALKRFETVVRIDAENNDAMKRKRELQLKIEQIDEEPSKLLPMLKKGVLTLLVIVTVVVAVFSTPTVMRKIAAYCIDQKMYAEPVVLNAQNLFMVLDLIENDPAKQKLHEAQIDEMIQDLMTKGNQAYREDRLHEALKAYLHARKLMEKSPMDQMQLDEVIKEIRLRIKLKSG